MTKSHKECGKIVHRPCSSCISSVQEINKDSIEFSLSTWTWRGFKLSWLKSYTNRKKRWLRLLALFLLSGVLIFLEKYKRNIWKNRENNKPSYKSINTTIVLVIIGNPMPPCLFLIISYWFLPGQLLGYLPSTPWWSLLSLAYLSNSGPVFFLSCLGSFECYCHSSLRLFVTPLFLIMVYQFWCSPILSHILFLFLARPLVLFLCDRCLFELFYIRLLFPD